MSHKIENFLRVFTVTDILLCAFLFATYSCSTPARSEKMVPVQIGIVKKHPFSVRVTVTGGQVDPPAGQPQITNSSFRQALTDSILKSGVFARIVDEPNTSADYLLVVTLFSMDKLVFR